MGGSRAKNLFGGEKLACKKSPPRNGKRRRRATLAAATRNQGTGEGVKEEKVNGRFTGEEAPEKRQNCHGHKAGKAER